MRKLSLEFVIDKLTKLYPEYDFSDVIEYKNNTQKIHIKCRKHGWFNSSINTMLGHIVKYPCPICRREYGNLMGVYYSNTEDFIHEYHRRWPNSVYDLSKVNYSGAKNNVTVGCKKHMCEFDVKAGKLMNNEHVCKQCIKDSHIEVKRNRDINKISTIFKSNQMFFDDNGIIFDLNRIMDVISQNVKTRFEKIYIPLHCNVHGEFQMRVGSVMSYIKKNTTPCLKCRGSYIDRKYTNEQFIDLLKSIYYDKNYVYDKTNYIDYKTKVQITCPVHGDFFRLPTRLVEGRGCPYCKESLLERGLRHYFDEHGVEYIFQYRNPKILGRKSLDFYIPKYSVGIECQGLQHLSLKSKFNSNHTSIDEVFEKDKLKKKICEEHNIRVLYFTKLKGYNYFDKLFTSEDELLKEITNGKKLL